MRDAVPPHAGESEAVLLLKRLFKPRPARQLGRALYAGAVTQARQPAFYSRLRAPDTLEGRFELYSLHVILLVLRLRGHGPEAQDLSQAVFDAYVDSLDIGLRELGVGDLSMGKKMKKLGRAFYGRVKSYETSLDDPTALEALLARTIYDGVDNPDTAAMAAYVRQARDYLAKDSLEELMAGEVSWPEVAT